MKIVAIGDRMMTAACRAGGVSETIVCSDASEADTALTTVLDRDDIGVVFVLDRFLERMQLSPRPGAYPVIVAIPGPEGPVGGEDAVSVAVRRVAGRHLPGGGK